MKRQLPALALACLTITALPALAQQQFHSNDVTPPSGAAGKLTGASSGRQVGAGSNGHAVLLTGNALSAVDLNPPGYYSTMATSTDDANQCGYGQSPIGTHALIWAGSSTSAVDLNPTGYNFSYCTGVHQGQAVGFAESQTYFLTASHAMLWTGTPTPVDLHPVGVYTYSRAMGVHDGEQVGYGSLVAYPYGDWFGYHSTSHAMRWAGSAASAVDLHPAGFDASEALATNGLQQGGWGYLVAGTSHLHALLWYGDATNVVDLNPAGYTESRVTALTATAQVGMGWVGPPGTLGSVQHALMWSGSAESVVDLNQYLPAGYTNASATGIDVDGNVVGYAYNRFSYGLAVPSDAIAVIFRPGQPPASTLTGLTLDSVNVAPGAIAQGLVTLSAPAPAGGTSISFLSTAPALAATPATIVIPEGAVSGGFTLPTGGANLMAPAALKLYASDGAVSAAVAVTVTPIVNLAAVTMNAVEGGFATSGLITLTIPAQAGGAVISLVSSNPSLVSVPATVTLPWGYTSVNFVASTTPVAAITSVPVTATLNGVSITTALSVNQAPVVAVSSLSAFPTVVGGQSIPVTLSMTNFPRAAGGAVVTLSSGDAATLQVPATVTVPYGVYSVTFQATSTQVSGIKRVAIKAVYNGTSANLTIMVNPIPTVTITAAEYITDLQLFKVQASTSYANSTLTYGTDPTAAPLGTMQFELGVFKGSTLMATAPAFATVWNSNGGSATMAVTVKTSSAATGGGGGGGGGTTASTFKLTVGKTGKGTVTTNPAGASFAAGTVVTLTAIPDPGSPWIGWSGACTGTSRSCTLTMTSNVSVTANFK